MQIFEFRKNNFNFSIYLVTLLCLSGLFFTSVGSVAGAGGSYFHGDIKEASGIARFGDDLLVVSDRDHGAYYKLSLNKMNWPAVRLNELKIERLTLSQGKLAVDIEAIEVLADGRIVVLSERLRSLLSTEGIVAEYDDPLAEIGERGLEGLAVRKIDDKTSQVAILWEGGYPEYDEITPQLRNRIGRKSMRPFIVVHNLRSGETGKKIELDKDHMPIELVVPLPEGDEPLAQRFRAPDLVWHELRSGGREIWGFIVLLNSQNMPEKGKPKYKHLWLQQFDLKGQKVGEPLNIDEHVPDNLKGANWEGLAWLEEGKSILLINDGPKKKYPPTIVMIDLSDKWGITDPKKSRFTHIISHTTEYYLSGPQQSRPPDGQLPSGTKVEVAGEAGSYTIIRTEDNISAYVAADILIKGSPGLMKVEPLRHKLENSQANIKWIYSDGPGWIVVHLDDNGRLGNIVGYTPIEHGWNTDVRVKLNMTDQSKVWAAYYKDKGTINIFEISDRPYSADFCESPDHPYIVCRYNLGFLPNACDGPGVPGEECHEELPNGLFGFTVVLR